MAIYYVDPNGGSDAAAGTSFATRWQTLTSGATAARIAAGDTIRIIASPDPTDMGQNATWTDGSQTVTLTSAVTADIYQSGAWTASSTNVNRTTSTNRKIGASSVSISPTAAFTTGKAAYYTLPSVTDFSAYQQVSFWITLTAGFTNSDGDLTLRLCSDTTGDVTVNTISIPRPQITSRWSAFTIDTGAALGSAIQSIALYVAVDNGAQTILLNNIIACKAPSAADSLSLTSLISKNTGTEQWIGLQSISGTSLVIDNAPQYNLSVATAPRGYSGATSTQTIYKREPIIMPSTFTGSNSTAWGTINDTGSAGNPITYSGGWNRTDMSTQTGDTYISGVNCGMVGINCVDTNSFIRQYIDFDKLNFLKCSVGYQIAAGSSGPNNQYAITVTAKDLNSNTTAITVSNQTSGTYYLTGISISVDNINGNTTVGLSTSSPGTSSTVPAGTNSYTIGNANSNYTTGINLGGSTQSVYNLTNLNRNAGGITASSSSMYNLINISKVDYNGTGIQSGTNNSYAITNSLSYNSTYAIQLISGDGNTFNLTGATATSNAVDVFGLSSGGTIITGGTFDASGINIGIITDSDITFNNPLGTSTITVANITTINRPKRLVIAGIAGNNSDNRIIYNTQTGDIATNTTTRHTASGVSWKMTAGSGSYYSPTASNPLTLPLAKIAVNASSLVTATVWVYRTDTNLVTKFVCPGGQIAGVSTDVVATASGAINTWEQLTITFTPSAQGVVALEIDCYGAAASVYVDDFGATQA